MSIPSDKKLNTLQVDQHLSHCNKTHQTASSLAVQKSDTCFVQADTHESKTGFIDRLIADHITSQTILVQNPPTTRLFRVMDTIAIDSLGSLTGNGITSVTWTLEQVYVLVNNDTTWSTLLTTPISSGPITTFTPYPAPQNNLLVEYLTWLESAFQSSGIQDSHGFRVLNPRFAGQRCSYEFELAVSANQPQNPADPTELPYVNNFVIAIRRQDDKGGNNVYLYVLNDHVNGNSNEQHVYYTTTGVLNPGMPDNTAFYAGYNLVFLLSQTDNYYGRFEQRYVLLQETV